MIDKYKLIERIRYSSKYNAPCPEWVYKAIEKMPDKEPKKSYEVDSEYIVYEDESDES